MNRNALAPFGLPDLPGGPRPMVFTSYVGCTGSFEVLAMPMPANRCRAIPQAVAQNNECFHDLSPISFRGITDGLSNTIVMMERATLPLADLAAIGADLPGKRGWYVSGNWGDTLATTFFPPNAFRKVALKRGEALSSAASSLHPGGVNVLLGDGSTRFVKESIQSWPFDPSSGFPLGTTLTAEGWWSNVPALEVWQALSTRAGGESIAGDDF